MLKWRIAHAALDALDDEAKCSHLWLLFYSPCACVVHLCICTYVGSHTKSYTSTPTFCYFHCVRHIANVWLYNICTLVSNMRTTMHQTMEIIILKVMFRVCVSFHIKWTMCTPYTAASTKDVNQRFKQRAKTHIQHRRSLCLSCTRLWLGALTREKLLSHLTPQGRLKHTIHTHAECNCLQCWASLCGWCCCTFARWYSHTFVHFWNVCCIL